MSCDPLPPVPPSPEAEAEIRRAVREILAELPEGSLDRSLIPLLQLVQQSLGYLPAPALLELAEALEIPPARVYGVATFYNQFRFTPPAKTQVQVCMGTACAIQRGGTIMEAWERRLGIAEGETSADLEFSLERVACVGCCALAPVSLLGGEVHPHMTPTKVDGLLLGLGEKRKSERLGLGEKRKSESLGLGEKRKSERQREASEAHATTGARDGEPVMTPAGRYEELRARARERLAPLLDPAGTVIRVGAATCGRSAGALELRDAFREALRERGLDAQVLEVGCMGHCYAEPMAVLTRPGYPPCVYHHLTPMLADALVNRFLLGEDPLYEHLLGGLGEHELIPPLSALPRHGREHRRLLARAGLVDPRSLDHALVMGAWSALAQALSTPSEDILEAVRRSGLRGLGGAGFPTSEKWALARSYPGPRLLVANADEGDPGAFMDRALIESDPQALLEGMAIAAHAIGAEEGFIYLRAEYPLAVEILDLALSQARAAGLLGKDILGSGIDFEVHLVRGAGAFVCGESSALAASIEGRRGMPRARPPRSAQAGLFGRPTVVSNVKTLASLPHILLEGPEAFASVGTASSKGTAIFALAGKVANTGLVEVPMGITLRELVHEIGGGVPGGRAFKAVQIGGPSGGCLPDAALDLPVDFDALGAAGAMMGSGGLVVLDEDNCMVETARYFLEFTQRESCGKCTFCRVGTRRMLDLLTDIVEGRGTEAHLARLQALCEDVRAGSLCGLGKTAPNPVLTTLRHFRDEYEAHIREGRCPSRECKALSAYYILPERCARACDACIGSCPVEAIFTNSKRLKVIEQALCVKCNACLLACPPQYDAVVRISPLSALPPQEPRPEAVATGTAATGTAAPGAAAARTAAPGESQGTGPAVKHGERTKPPEEG
ncbi:MAG: NAD(P)H-dependent oxidoreductase subunit E [Polyangia bacterium]|jgi:NADH-quinone oxidoreductase subunit F|nr:NAD(P)H-dependent oxidoreductase subunit E [Polyangia bacterium]